MPLAVINEIDTLLMLQSMILNQNKTKRFVYILSQQFCNTSRNEQGTLALKSRLVRDVTSDWLVSGV